MPLNAATEVARLSIAPMMDWTDRHCRYLHRLLSRRALLYTEMVTAPAVLHGDRARLLRFDPAEHPVALQLGGSDPDDLARATAIACDLGFDEVNLNVGCPSDRVQSGTFGAILMKTPGLVADCVTAMIEAATVDVTVKCRIGVDEQEPKEALPRFLEAVTGAGIRRVTIHARKAWLSGLSPKENRTVPPLDYALVHEMKAAFPELHISINGGITSLDDALAHLRAGLDGVMIGRAAYQTPAQVLFQADQRIFGEAPRRTTLHDIVRGMYPHIEEHLSDGGRLNAVTRHMLGLFSGQPGARAWRRILSEGAHRDGAGIALIEHALAHVSAHALDATG